MVYVYSRFSCVRLFATLGTLAHQSPLSMVILQVRVLQLVACPPLEDLPNLGIEPTSLTSPALPGGFFTTSAIGEASGI